MTSDRTQSGVDAIYQQVILQHNRDPVGFNQVEGANITVKGHNPVCGDHISMAAFFSEDKATIEKLAFAEESCAICTASASLLCQQLQRLPINQIHNMAAEFIDFIQQAAELGSEKLQPMQVFSELHRLPTRQRCATLPWETLLKLLQEFEQQNE